MGKMVAPFSNATEAEMWLNRNCYSCTTSKNCTAFKHLEEGFIFGGISERTARYIGTVNITPTYCDLEMFCKNKDKRYIKIQSICPPDFLNSIINERTN